MTLNTTYIGKRTAKWFGRKDDSSTEHGGGVTEAVTDNFKPIHREKRNTVQDIQSLRQLTNSPMTWTNSWGKVTMVPLLRTVAFGEADGSASSNKDWRKYCHHLLAPDAQTSTTYFWKFLRCLDGQWPQTMDHRNTCMIWSKAVTHKRSRLLLFTVDGCLKTKGTEN